MSPHLRLHLPRTPSHAVPASAAAVRSTGALAYVHEEPDLTFRPQKRPLAPVYIEEFAINNIVNGIPFLKTNSDSVLIATSAAARQSSNSSAANPRSSFVAHSHRSLFAQPAARVHTSPHPHTHAARPEQPVFISSIEQFRPRKWPLAPIYIEEFATNSIVINTAKIDSNFQSVGVQSGIFTGDGGFDITVGGKTELIGSAITTTDKAVQEGKNKFTSAGGITTVDLQNTASYQATASNTTAGIKAAPGQDAGGNSITKLSPIFSGGIGEDSGKASSASQAGISGIAGNTAARTGDKETGLVTIFDKDKVNKNLDAQVGLVQEVAPAAAKAWGQYANSQMTNDKLSAEERACWAPDGACRAGGHALIGGLTAGGPGAAGAGLTSVAAPHVYTTLVNNGISPDVAQSLTTLGAAGFAAQLGGTPAATAAANEAVNNFGMFIRLAQIASDKATRFGQATLTAGERAILSAAAALGVVSAQKALQAPEPRFDNSQPIPTGPNMVAPPPEGKDSNNTGNTKPLPNYSGSTVTPVEQRDPRDGVLINPAAPPVNAGSNNTGGNQIIDPKPGSNVITTPIAAPQGPNIMMSDSRTPVPQVTAAPNNGLPYESNDKHTPGTNGYDPKGGIEPRNSFDLFGNSVAHINANNGKETRYTVDANGEIHRFSNDGNGIWHWSGSSADVNNPLAGNAIPTEIRRLPGVNSDIRTRRR
jgi:hypothetical protein